MTTTQAPHYPVHVAGAPADSADATSMPLLSPATGAELATVAVATPADVDRAVALARGQIDGGEWSLLSGMDRSRLLNRLADLVERDSEILARLDAETIGRPVAEAMGFDLPNAIQTWRTFAGWADKIEGRVIDTPGYFGSPLHSFTTHVPVGVVAAILPWNAPTMIASWKFAPALAAGCAIVAKPAEESPLSVLHLARLAEEAGFPAGVLSVVPGPGEVTGKALAEHPGVNKISFTGSPEVGRVIAHIAAEDFKRVSLELGGKSPQIVFPDADLDAVMAGLAAGIFSNQGQVCAAGSRVLVHRSCYQEVVERLAQVADGIVLGEPLDPTAQMGSLASRAQYDRVVGYIEAGRSSGARIAAGGDVRPRDTGFYVRPTVFADVENSSRIAQEEIFGPVACVIPFDTDEEAIAIANDTTYGLAATVWTRDVTRALTVAAAIKAGSVGVNGWTPIDPHLPWGGFKTSGIGRELGYSGLLAYTEEKVVNIVL